MPERNGYDHGTPSWLDLMSPDVDASKEFYSGLFGWESEDQHDEDGQRIYTTFRQGGRDVAGLGGQMPGTEGGPPAWNAYVAVDDADDVARKVADAGGQVLLEPMQVMDAGRMAVFADPTGAVMSVWQAANHPGAGVTHEPGTWLWTELMDRDVETAKSFYADVFGWEWNTMDMGDAGPYHVVAGGEDGLAGAMAMPEDVPDGVPNHWQVYFEVTDVEATCRRAEELGGSVAFGPMDSPVGPLANLLDPHGGSFAVMQPTQ